VSLLATPEASPGRVLTVFHLLDQQPEGRIEYSRAEQLLSPEPLRFARKDDAESMVRELLKECTKLGFVRELSVKRRPWLELTCEMDSATPSTQRTPFRYFGELIFAADNETNHDLALALAWFLEQDPLSFRGDWDSIERRIGKDFPSNPFGLQNVRYSQLRDWAVFLGLAWTFASRGAKWLVPDPRRNVAHVLATSRYGAKERVPVREVLEFVGEQTPVLEFGRFREKLSTLYADKEQKADATVLSPASSQAWLSLEDEGKVELLRIADAPQRVQLQDGPRQKAVTHVTTHL